MSCIYRVMAELLASEHAERSYAGARLGIAELPGGRAWSKEEWLAWAEKEAVRDVIASCYTDKRKGVNP